MKFMHISDLHIGKRVNDFSMLEEQKYILDEILKIAKTVDGVLIAGDVYDKSIPPTDAVDLFDEFLTNISSMEIPVFIISGNHDSPERLNFGSRIFKRQNVHIAGEYNGTVMKIPCHDEFGTVNVFLLPYVKPVIVNHILDIETRSYDECVRAVIDTCDINTDERNILVAHQFVTAGGQAPETSESETKSLGGLDNVDYTAFDKFDYAALGHIHGPQRIGRDTVRYSGSPLKYSFSECRQKKSVTIVNVGESEVTYELVPLIPKRDMEIIECKLSDLASQKADKDSYVHVTLTDEEELADAISKVRAVYPNVMLLDIKNSRTAEGQSNYSISSEDIKQKSISELFSDFYQKQNNSKLNENQISIIENVIKEISE